MPATAIPCPARPADTAGIAQAAAGALGDNGDLARPLPPLPIHWAEIDSRVEQRTRRRVARCIILRPPFEPCMRFSRTRLTDTVHRQACAGP